MEQIKTLPALSFVQAFDAAFKKIFQFNGRARRSEYWWPVAVVFLVSLFKPLIGGILSLLTIPLTFRRLHDTGRSGWWWGGGVLLQLAFFVFWGYDLVKILIDADRSAEYDHPYSIVAKYCVFIVIIVLYQVLLLVFLCLDSEKGENRYGSSPKYVMEDESSQRTDDVK